MKLYFNPRKSGKTTNIILDASKDNGIIICENSNQCKSIKIYAKNMNLKIEQPITISKFIKLKSIEKKNKIFHFDDLEFCLMKICNVGSISMSNDENTFNRYK